MSSFDSHAIPGISPSNPLLWSCSELRNWLETINIDSIDLNIAYSIIDKYEVTGLIFDAFEKEELSELLGTTNALAHMKVKAAWKQIVGAYIDKCSDNHKTPPSSSSNSRNIVSAMNRDDTLTSSATSTGSTNASVPPSETSPISLLKAIESDVVWLKEALESAPVPESES